MAPNAGIRLAIEGLDAGYGAVKALRGVSLNVEAGETVALLGTNGNGKSTLMKCVAGLVRSVRGSVALEVDGTTMPNETIWGYGAATTGYPEPYAQFAPRLVDPPSETMKRSVW